MDPGIDTEIDTETSSRWPYVRPIRLVAASAAAYLVGGLLFNRVAAILGVPFDAASGMVLALGVVFGLAVAVGAGIGAVLLNFSAGQFGPIVAVEYASAFLLVTTGTVLWNTLGRHRWFEGGGTDVARLVAVAVPAAVTAAAVTAWGVELLVRAPFSIAFNTAVVNLLLGTLVGGALFYPIARRLAGMGIPVSPPDPAERLVFSDRRIGILTAVLPFVWAASGIAVSLVLQPLQTAPRQTIADRFGWTVASIISTVGPAGRQLQVVLGAVALALLVVFIFVKTGHDV